jgi:predicted MFS family arabinose efflux permease
MVLPLVAGAIPLGILIDRTSRTRLLVLFLALCTLGTVLTALARSFGGLVAARALTGLAASATVTAALSWVADSYPEAQRGRASMVGAIGEIFGIAAAFELGGTLLTAFQARAGHWQSAMLSLAIPVGTMSGLALTMREPKRGMRRKELPVSRAWGLLWAHRRTIAPLVVGKILVGTAYGAVLTWASPALSRRFWLAPNEIGETMAVVVAVSGLVGPVVGGTLADWCQRSGGPPRTAAVVGILAAASIPLGLFSIMPGIGGSRALLGGFMVTVAVIGVAEMTLTTVVVPAEIRALCLSVLLTAGLVFGAALAPMLVSALSSRAGSSLPIGQSLALICSGTGILGALAFTYVRRAVGRV